jgi:hypothetical protein
MNMNLAAQDVALRIVEAVRKDGDPAFAHLLVEFDAAVSQPKEQEELVYQFKSKLMNSWIECGADLQEQTRRRGNDHLFDFRTLRVCKENTNS